MPRFMARAIYTLTTPDGREVGTLYETQGGELSVQLDPDFHATAQGGDGAGARDRPHLVVKPVRPTRRCD